MRGPRRCADRAGQASMEVAVGVVVAMLLLSATLWIWVWLDKMFVKREEKYQRDPVVGRLQAGRPGGDVFTAAPADWYQPNNYAPERLSLFGESE